MRFIRTGILNLTPKEMDLTENYLRAAGIRGKSKWEKPWERTTKQIQEEELAVCEGVRAFLAEKLVPFIETMKKKGQTARAFTECLYDFLVECRMQEVLSAREQALEESGDLDRAKEYHQIYGIILELLDKVVELLGEEEITLEEYEQILEAGFEEAKAGMIPP